MTETIRSDRIPAEITERIAVHGEQSPYHRRRRQELGVDYGAFRTWGDLREAFALVDDEQLRQIDPSELVPAGYDDTTLVRSRSSGTTGEPKEAYWHPADIEDNVDALVDAFDVADIPRGADWVATATPNPVLKETLRGLASRFDGTTELIEMDPEPIKQALATNDEGRIADALSEPAERVQRAITRTEAAVYEDIAPLMAYVGRTLPAHARRHVEQLFIGGVGTTADVVRRLTDDAFPNAALAGWYGDYLNGFAPMRASEALEYSPPYPHVRFDVVDPKRPTELVAPGERGAVVSHTVRRGFFVPNRWVGDSARRIVVGEVDGLAAIERLNVEPARDHPNG